MKLAWVGNSYVYFNDLPSMLAAMLATCATIECTHEQVTPGGERLAGHAKNPEVARLLDAGNTWDAVVLQDNSAVPGGSDAAALAASHAALDEYFAPRVERQTVWIYGTWGHRLGCVYRQHREAYPDYETMQARTTAGCEGYAERLGCRMVPVGDAFRRVHELDVAAGVDPLDADSLFSRLYAPDDFHPSRLGSYLSCCCFYAALTGASPVGTPFRPAERCEHDERMLAAHPSDAVAWAPKPLSEADALALQQAAAFAVRGFLRAETTGGCDVL